MVQAPLAAWILGVVASTAASVADGILRQVAVEKVLQRGPFGTSHRTVCSCLLVDVPLCVIDVIQSMTALCEALIQHWLVTVFVLVGGDFHRESVNHLVDIDGAGIAHVLARDRAGDESLCVVNVKLAEQELFQFLEKLVDRPVRQRSRPLAVRPSIRQGVDHKQVLVIAVLPR